ncbi:hypothetical protein AB0P21_40010 [Kribbella sp. NPDC056861]|uniref:hypothetical protein n=1 Tax=Kribbella sp. NPDC056861 TaxID=3154857 RepID=UPI0034133C3D
MTHPVVGVWEVSAQGAPFGLHMMTFHPAGTMLQSNPDSGNRVTSDSAGMGVWKVGARSVRGRFMEAHADRTTGRLVGKSVISFELTVDGDHLTGTAEAIRYDAAGRPVGDPSPARLVGSRLTYEDSGPVS